METRMLFAGFGGQGLLFMGKVLAYTGMLSDKQVTWIPSYGPEMRGGTANCSVIISDEEIASPMVHYPDVLVAMNQPSLDKFGPKVKEGGLIVVNTSIIKDVPEFPGREVICIEANDIAAAELGSVRAANMVVTGLLAQKLSCITKESLLQALEEVGPNAKIAAANKIAVEAGLKQAV